MTDKNLTHLYFLLDRSGSMASIRRETEAGFDAFVAEQRRGSGKCRVTLAQFDDEYDEVYAGLDVHAVPPLRLRPRGSSALLDSLGRLITAAGERLAALPEGERPASVVVGVLTDGYENASREWTHERIRALIDQQTHVYNWEFMYLGADQDAIEVGARMGFDARKSMTYSRGKADKAMAGLSRNVRAYRDEIIAGASIAAAKEATAFTDDRADEAIWLPGCDDLRGPAAQPRRRRRSRARRPGHRPRSAGRWPGTCRRTASRGPGPGWRPR